MSLLKIFLRLWNYIDFAEGNLNPTKHVKKLRKILESTGNRSSATREPAYSDLIPETFQKIKR
jgi:hypothetical protein